VSTAPGATPTVVRSWQDDGTRRLELIAVNTDGSVIGYGHATGTGASRYFPGYVYELNTQRELRVLDPRVSPAYAGGPAFSRDGSTAVVKESCLGDVPCEPFQDYGWYAFSLDYLRR
jgi:hypothetical protein